MLKFIIAFERNRAMTRAQCHAHLQDVHGPLVRSVPAFTRHVRRYVQNFAQADLPCFARSGLVPDGAAELWFDDAASFVRAYAEPLYLADVRPDEANFTDPGRYVASVTRERLVWDDGGDPAVKLVRFLAPVAHGGDASAAVAGERAERLASDALLRALAVRFVQALPVAADENPFPQARGFAAVESLWFAGRGQAESFLELERQRHAAADAESGRSRAPAIGLLACEFEVIGGG